MEQPLLNLYVKVRPLPRASPWLRAACASRRRLQPGLGRRLLRARACNAARLARRCDAAASALVRLHAPARRAPVGGLIRAQAARADARPPPHALRALRSRRLPSSPT
jgi:hypothetical protein